MANKEVLMTLEELRKEVFTAMQSKKPAWYRKGQFVFNYIDFEYGVARAVQFDDGIDCFYVDENIDAFLEACVERINQK